MPRHIHLDRPTKRQRVRKGRAAESRKGQKARDRAANTIYWS